MRIIIILLTVTFFVSSCSVDKRLYSSGYHVDWNFNKSPVTSVKRKDNSQVTPKRVKIGKITPTPISNQLNIVPLAEKIEIQPLLFKNNQTILSEDLYVNTMKQPQSMKPIVVEESLQLKDVEMKSSTSNQTKTSPRKGVLSIIFSILSWGFIIIGINMLFSSTVILGWVILALAAVVLIAAFTLGISATDNPNDKIDFIFGVIGTAISVVSILLIIGSIS